MYGDIENDIKIGNSMEIQFESLVIILEIT